VGDARRRSVPLREHLSNARSKHSPAVFGGGDLEPDAALRLRAYAEHLVYAIRETTPCHDFGAPEFLPSGLAFAVFVPVAASGDADAADPRGGASRVLHLDRGAGYDARAEPAQAADCPQHHADLRVPVDATDVGADDNMVMDDFPMVGRRRLPLPLLADLRARTPER
jgi:hypothetical protein